MTTGEEQGAAAERIAALNPEWTWRAQGEILVHTSKAFVWTAGETRWEAHPHGAPTLRGANGRVRLFHSPGAAIAALGLSIKESPNE